MLKVSDGAGKGSYVAKVTGTDEKFGIKREFLPLELKFTKKKGVAEIFINPEHLMGGDVIALKIIKPGETEGKENFYRIVGEPPESTALHNIVKKIPGGKEDVVKLFQADALANVSTSAETTGKPVIVATNVKKGSYVAKLTGADEKFGFKREFISKTIFDKEEKKNCLVVSPADIPKGTVITLKRIGGMNSGGEVTGDGKEVYYQIDKDPIGTELHKIVRKIDRAEARATNCPTYNPPDRADNTTVMQRSSTASLCPIVHGDSVAVGLHNIRDRIVRVIKRLVPPGRDQAEPVELSQPHPLSFSPRHDNLAGGGFLSPPPERKGAFASFVALRSPNTPRQKAGGDCCPAKARFGSQKMCSLPRSAGLLRCGLPHRTTAAKRTTTANKATTCLILTRHSVM